MSNVVSILGNHALTPDDSASEAAGTSLSETGSKPFNDARPQIELPGNHRLISDFAADLAEAIRDRGIYRRDESPVTFDDETCGVRAVSDQKIRTLIEQDVVCFTKRTTNDGETFTIKKTIPADSARALIASPQLLRRLKPVHRANRIRLPVMRRDGRIELLPTGYDEETGTLTREEGFDPERAVDGRAVIEDVLSEFCFADDARSKAVAISAMVSTFAGGLLSRYAIRPAFIFLANSEGAGKTLLADCALIPVFNEVRRLAWKRDEGEMEKLITASIMEAHPVLFFDNAKRHLDSAPLEALITSAVWQGRILGQSRTFSGYNLATVFITGNGCTVSPDLRRRSLFVELFLAEARPEDRRFSKRLNQDVIRARRPDILAGLWDLVQRWDQAGRPGPSVENVSFPEWGDAIAGIVEHAGFSCPLVAPGLRDGGDQDAEDVATLVAELKNMHTYTRLTPKELAKVAFNSGLFERIFQGEEKLDRSGKSKLAKLLKRYDCRIFGSERTRFVIEGSGHNRRYTVKSA